MECQPLTEEPSGKRGEGVGRGVLWLNPKGQNIFWLVTAARRVSGGERSSAVKAWPRTLCPMSLPLPCVLPLPWDWRNDMAVRNTPVGWRTSPSGTCAMGSLLRTHFCPVPPVVCGLSAKLVRMQWREGPPVLQGVLSVIPLSQPPRKAAPPDRGDVMGSLSNRLWVH